ncbi:MAG: DUF4129 domain-containing protein [bacterium]
MIALTLTAWLLTAWPGAEAARAVAEQVTRDEGLQTPLPEGAPVAAPPEPPPDFPKVPSRPPQVVQPSDGSGLALGQIVLITLGALLLIGLAAVLLRERITAPPPTADTRPAEEPEAIPERAILTDADRLAAAGRYAEAVHALLLRTIEALARRVPVPRALTSREILDRAALPEDARAAFAELVAAVELTRFGGRRAAADDYTRCVDCFDRIRHALLAARPAS